MANEDDKWKTVRGLMIADGWLYYATGSGDDLFRARFSAGKPVSGTTTPVAVLD